MCHVKMQNSDSELKGLGHIWRPKERVVNFVFWTVSLELFKGQETMECLDYTRKIAFMK